MRRACMRGVSGNGESYNESYVVGFKWELTIINSEMSTYQDRHRNKFEYLHVHVCVYIYA